MISPLVRSPANERRLLSPKVTDRHSIGIIFPKHNEIRSHCDGTPALIYILISVRAFPPYLRDLPLRLQRCCRAPNVYAAPTNRASLQRVISPKDGSRQATLERRASRADTRDGQGTRDIDVKRDESGARVSNLGIASSDQRMTGIDLDQHHFPAKCHRSRIASLLACSPSLSLSLSLSHRAPLAGL